MKLPRYPKYKDSGVKWLGQVPEHWEVTRMKWSVTACKNGVWGNETQQDEDDIPCVRVADFDRNRLTVKLNEPTIRNVAKKDRVERTLRRENLLLEKSGGGEQQPVGCVVLYDDDAPAVCSNFIARVEIAPKMTASYWRYVHAAAYFVRLNTRSINQTSGIQNLDQTRYFDEQAAFPPPDEQVSIAAFLEHETEKIDLLINEQQHLIELLKEKRQAVISHAVTKGLNPDAPMKNSGVKWLGQVPEHWDVYRLGVLFREINEAGNDDLPTLSVSIHDGVSDRQLAEDELERKVNRSEDASKYKKVVPSDLVYNMMRAWQGGFGTVTVPGQVSPAYVVARPKWDFASRFIELLLRTPQAIEEIRCHSHGVTDFRLRLYWDNFKIIRVALPPRSEQSEILALIENMNERFDKLIEAATLSIATLQERRSALISAAVTGQIDARAYQSEASNVVALSTRKASPGFVRTVLAAEIVHQLHLEPTFGHVKFQKIFHLAQYYAEIEDFDSNYTRQAAGPFDHGLVKSVEKQMRNAKWYDCQRDGGRYYFSPMEKAGGHGGYFTSYYGAKRDKIQHIIDLCRKMTTEQCEIVSTLYGAWNDLLLAGSAFTDDVIVQEVLTHWHSAKERIDESRWKRALSWMRDHDLTPKGKGKPIKTRVAEGRT